MNGTGSGSVLHSLNDKLLQENHVKSLHACKDWMNWNEAPHSMSNWDDILTLNCSAMPTLWNHWGQYLFVVSTIGLPLGLMAYWLNNCAFIGNNKPSIFVLNPAWCNWGNLITLYIINPHYLHLTWLLKHYIIWIICCFMTSEFIFYVSDDYFKPFLWI